MPDSFSPAKIFRHESGVRPLIGVTCDIRDNGGSPFHMAGHKYLTAIADGAGGHGVLIPSLADRTEIPALLSRLDGILCTGSPSNVLPALYGQGESREGTLHDPGRDALSLPMIAQAIELGVPVLAICRGIQELNVSLGGSLHQHVQELPGKRDHREDETLPKPAQYAIAHPIKIAPGGLLERIIAAETVPPAACAVNSLHGQAINQVAPGLRVEAHAPDGIVEAVSVPNAPAFALGVQWHPEWQVLEHPLYAALFRWFGRAAAERALAQASLAQSSLDSATTVPLSDTFSESNTQDPSRNQSDAAE